jgi:beta-1,2-mannobiose phosphorylase / 1,2-beta-oligomannan phosphorylase
VGTSVRIGICPVISSDGQLHLFPRLVAEGNFSRGRRARVLFDSDETPVAVERLGVVLEPDETWEANSTTAGVEDPRITFVPSLDLYVMTYAAFGPLHSRIGLAVSNDLVSWERLGPAWFAYEPSLRADLNLYTNKDAVLFPDPVAAPDGRPRLCPAAPAHLGSVVGQADRR